jgi:hypothetical protein
MMKSFLTFCFLFSALFSATSQLAFSPEQHHEIIIHNKPLARVNGKTISLYDVVNRMNTVLCTKHPEAFKDKNVVFQYYQSHWKAYLEEMVSNELILADAEDKEVEVSEGDIRKKLENDYGAQLFTKLDEMGMTLEEAKEMVKRDLIIQQMTWFRAYNKALQSVTPNQVKEQYLAEKDQFKPKDHYTYQVFTLRGPTELAKKLGEEAYSLLNEQNKEASEVVSTLTAKCEKDNIDVKISLSSDFSMESGQIAAQHMEVLSSLPLKTFSKPVMQSGKAGDVVRIFYIKDRETIAAQPFTILAASLKDKLTEFYAAREKKAYIDRLKKQYRAEDHETYFDLPKDYKPFDLF